MAVIDIHAPKLQALAPRLEKLMKRAHGNDERAPLEYLLGALHGLFLATPEFKDRSFALDDARGRSPEGIEYWEYGPLKRVQLMTQGRVRVGGAWAAGFYFNAALARMASVFDRAVRFKAAQKGIDRPRPGSGRPPSVRELLRALGLGGFTQGKLALVYDEVTPLKHKAAGLAWGRKVKMADAVVAFEQLLQLLEHPRMR